MCKPKDGAYILRTMEPPKSAVMLGMRRFGLSCRVNVITDIPAKAPGSMVVSASWFSIVSATRLRPANVPALMVVIFELFVMML